MNKNKIFEIVIKIPEGEFLTYKQVAELIGKPKAYRYVANVLAENKDLKIPCHRVIRNDHAVGGYFGSEKNSWKKLALLLREGVIAVMPTDTIYGICTSAFKKKSVEKIYQLRKRNPQKPCIILISKTEELKNFGIKLRKTEKEFLKKTWPAKISVILEIKDKDKLKQLRYLHRGTKTLAFRLPKPKWLRKILEISGPLVAPSANWESYPPAKTINEAKKYFSDNVIYFNKGKINTRPSKVIELKNKKINIIRE